MSHCFSQIESSYFILSWLYFTLLDCIDTLMAPLHSTMALRHSTWLDKEQLRVWWPALPTSSWNSHGHLHGPFLRKHLYGQTWTTTGPYQKKASNMVAIHWWRILPLESWRRKSEQLCRRNQPSTPHHQIHNRMVQKQCVIPGHNCKDSWWTNSDRPVCETIDNVRTVLSMVKPTDTHQYFAANSCRPKTL